jgi:diguanylate cyclase (GGDEF)-like protein
MHRSHIRRRIFLTGFALLATLFLGLALANVSDSAEPAQLLKQADIIKTSNHAEFLQIMSRLGGHASKLSPEQRFYLSYLQGWQVAYTGDYGAAVPLLNAVIEKSNDEVLRFRVRLTLVNMLGLGAHYQEAFTQISELLDQLPEISDKTARIQALAVAALLYNQAGQYETGLVYAEQLLNEDHVGDGACYGMYYKIEALYKAGQHKSIDDLAKKGIDICSAANKALYANGIRFYVASFDMDHGKAAAAIKLLSDNYADVQRIGYPWVISEFESLLAQSYWRQGNWALAKKFAINAVAHSIKNEYTKPLTSAYEVLYQIEQMKGDSAAALTYHEKYMAADKAYLTEVSTRALAYQAVKQQVAAKKMQIGELSKENQILQLRQALDTKASETTRLYVALLLTILASVAFWAYRVKRSQLRFMKMARRDGLTGIFNRQHFVAAAEQQLQYCEKSKRVASLIVIDLDHFKIVNDTHGHAAGDHVLCRAAAACQAHLRSTDVFGRLGGEEFGILMPECDGQRTASRAELIRVAISSVSDSEETQGIMISASFGVASTTYASYNLRQLLIHADKALYTAKREGRNRVVLFDGTGQVDVTTLTLQSLQRR